MHRRSPFLSRVSVQYARVSREAHAGRQSEPFNPGKDVLSWTLLYVKPKDGAASIRRRRRDDLGRAPRNSAVSTIRTMKDADSSGVW